MQEEVRNQSSVRTAELQAELAASVPIAETSWCRQIGTASYILQYPKTLLQFWDITF